MALQSSGQISMGDIADEIGLNKSDLDLAGGSAPSGATSNTPNANGACFDEAWTDGTGNFGAGSAGVDKDAPHQVSEFYGYDHYAGFEAALSQNPESVYIDTISELCNFSTGTSDTVYTFWQDLPTAATNSGDVYVLDNSVYTLFNNKYPFEDYFAIQTMTVTEYYTVNASSQLSGPTSCP